MVEKENILVLLKGKCIVLELQAAVASNQALNCVCVHKDENGSDKKKIVW